MIAEMAPALSDAASYLRSKIQTALSAREIKICDYK